MKKELFFVIILLCFLTLSCVSAIDNETYDLNNKLCTNASVVDYSFNSLNEIINHNSTLSEIKLDKDYIYSQSDDFSEGIVINRSVTIDGQGHTIDAKKQSRIFTINAKNVTLKNIRFINSFSNPTCGGLISFNENTSGHIINSIFVNGTARYGGGIYFDSNSEGIIENSTFSNCFSLSGAAICFSVYSSSIVNNCFFYNNSAKDSLILGEGGAIFYGPYVNSTIVNSTFVGNSATLYGGAINFGEHNNVLIYNSNFINNHALKYGGAIQQSDYTNIKVFNSCFINNNAKNGGAVYYSWKSSNIINSTFINNTAKESGGAVYYYFGSKNTIYNSEFSKNSAKNGGAVFYRDRTKGLINNSVFTENSAECGGAVYYLNQSAKSIINNSVFIRNFAKSASAYNAGKIYNCTVVKITPKLSSNKVNSFYNDNKYLTVTLKDHNNRPIKDASVNIQLNGNSKTLKTNSNGQVRLSVKALQPGSYNAVISFSGDDNFEGSKIISNIHIKKANTKILAKKKTFKAKKKNKKYTIVLKGVSSKFNVQLKIKGKKYNAVTKANGKAIFKLKLNKKGKYKATIKFKGDKNYKSSTKKVTIKIK